MSSSEANSSSDTSGRPPSWPTSWRLPSSWRLPYVVPAVGGGGRAGGVVLAAGTGGCPTARPVKPVSPVPSDIDIAQSVKPVPVKEVFKGAFGLKEEDVFSYGPYKGKINLNIWSKLKDKPNGHYVVVCGINPTPLGEGKSTTTVGLSQALGAFLGQKVLTNIRQPSMGPTFGIKGGAAGGGYAQCFPMEDFNLHMTGDIHAITAAHNLFAAAIDTRYYHENSSSAKGIWNRLCPVDKNGKREFEPTMYARLEKLGLGHKKENPDLLTEEEIEKFCILDIDPDTITWKRVTDCSDKYLRKVEIGLSPSEFSKKKNEQMKRTSSYGITVSSEIMAILALATDLKDLRSRLGKMICCYSKKGEPITADDFGITGALAVLMMDALPPNTMQTLEGTPALVHAGPFANIAHGNSSIISDLIGLKLVGKDGYVLTEAGFGSDMGGEKFFNIKCYYSGLKPDCAVIVCSVRALKLHSCEAPKIVAGQTPAKEYREENLDLVEKGCANLIAHIQNVRKHGVKAVVAINRFGTDTDAELALVKKIAEENGAFAAVVAEHHAKGGAGATALGEAVMAACKTPSDFKFLYDAKKDSIKSKILKVVQEVYGGADVKYSEKAEAVLSRYQADPAINCLPICMSKTQYSLSDDAKKLGAPKGFTITVQDMYVSAGAGFIVVSLGDITFMPGLPIKPAYYKIDLDFTQDPPRVVGLS
ncbi:Formate--tetrahydrofolate ligase (10-formyletrahydrofolate synthetase) (FHS) (FTHFS) (Formyltetrahydrofolate synthetase) [Durusdinium trenchii]|uniref:formate--tetrahydrofolate ligase n=1 Tax=Durusdinium trenchii TaxID=1381693 RepID=A0ABP0L9D4_9DINO